MTDITDDDVLELAGELTTVSAEAWVWILAFVNQHDLTALDEDEDTAQLARIYLAAHIAKVTELGATVSAGPLTSESVGGVRRAYGLMSAASTDSLGTTRYGLMYLSILKSSAAHGPLLC